MTIVNIKISPYAYTSKGGAKLISYEPFWETLKARGMTTYTLITKYNISSATIDRIKKGQGITTAKVDDFCRILRCKVADIIEYIEDEA